MRSSLPHSGTMDKDGNVVSKSVGMLFKGDSSVIEKSDYDKRDTSNIEIPSASSLSPSTYIIIAVAIDVVAL